MPTSPPVAIDLEAQRGTLESWLSERLSDHGPVRIGEFDRPTSGFSAETLILPMVGIRCWSRPTVDQHPP